MCLYPKLIINPKYKPNKKNGYRITQPNDARIMAVPIGCGQCIECRKKKAREWQVRMSEEIRTNKNGKMYTLTFNTESLKKIQEEYITKTDKKGIEYTIKIKDLKGYEKDNAIATKAVRLFLERYRKKYKKSVRHWLITELGGGRYEHLHIHGIIWTNETKQTIEKIWQYGTAWQGTFVNEKTVNYIIKYFTKIDEKHKYYKPVILCSKGIGNNYTQRTDSKNNKYKEKTDESYTTRTGLKLALPIYYRNKIYTEEQREKLWIEKLDNEERYVMGKKISIKQNDEEYKAALKYAQKVNKELGYGDDKQNWDEKKYEEQRRELLQKQRQYKANAQ